MRTKQDKEEWDLISKNISQLIDESWKSQKQIADELGMSEQIISNYKNGHSIPLSTQYRKLCRVLDCEYSDIFGRVE